MAREDVFARGVKGMDESKEFESEKDEKDFLDQLIDRALGNFVVIRTPYGYMMSSNGEHDPWKKRPLAPVLR
jgi:hypothetical protein